MHYFMKSSTPMLSKPEVSVTVIGSYLDPFFIGYQFTEMLYLCRFLRITLIKKSA